MPGASRRVSPAAGRPLAAFLFVSLLTAAPRPAAGATTAPPDLARVEALAAQGPSTPRDRALRQWSERQASLAELLFVLRRSPAQLGPSEAVLVEAALKRVPASRAALRRRLLARLALVAPERERFRPEPDDGNIVHPRASVFQVAALLPDSGDYQAYGRSVLEGLRAGIADSATVSPTPIEVTAHASGEDDPSRAIAAFDAAAPRSGAAVGELLSVPTLVLAAASRYAAIPLISPTATDEEIGAMGRNVFQVGPSGYARGRRLAAAVLTAPARVGMLVSSAAAHGPFASGFRDAAAGAGVPVVWQDDYSAGSLNFRDKVRALAANRVELLFWDGDAREAEALVRQLTRERISLKLCGSSGLAPEEHHSETRALLEGVQYVGDDWQAGEALRARLDRIDAGGEGSHARSLVLRGYLAGRSLSAALASGALCPEETTAFLAAHTLSDSYLRARGFLDMSGEGVTLWVYRVEKGKSVAR